MSDIRTIQADIIAGFGFFKNYITNSSAELNTVGWLTYADAAGATPVDMTGGSPTTTWTRSTSAPLRGAASFLLTKDAANRQGEGVSFLHSMDTADQAKIMQITFDYEITSGTYVTGDLTVAAYDVTNSTYIQPAGYQILALSSTRFRHVATFQTSASGISYRFGFHVATTSALAYTVKIDNIVVGPQVTAAGAAMNAWSLTPVTTPSATAFGTVTNNKIYTRRVGDTLQIRGSYTMGTVTGNSAFITLPFSMDTAKLGTIAADAVGIFWAAKQNATAASFSLDGSTTNITGTLFFDGTNATQLFFSNQGASNGYVKRNASTLFSSNDSVGFYAEVPISGWDSNTVMSNDTDTRVVSLRAGSVSSSLSGSVSTIVFSNKIKDTHGAYNSSTGVYTIPVSGTYRVMSHILLGGTFVLNTTNEMDILKNGTTIDRVPNRSSAAVSDMPLWIFGEYDFVAGDTLTVQAASGATAPAYISSDTLCTLNIDRISGPATIAASESVNASYGTSANTALSTATTIVWNTTNYGTHNAMVSATGIYTAPTVGKYRVSCFFMSAPFTPSSGNYYIIELCKNGTSRNLRLAMNTTNTAVAQLVHISGSATISLLAGDTIRLVTNFSSGTFTLGSDATANYVNIEKVG